MCSRSRLLLLATVMLVATACGGSGPSEGAGAVDDLDVSVIRVIDGDSLELDIDGASAETRLVAINAPEFDDCQGPAARAALAGVVEDRILGIDIFGIDRFGRTLIDLQVAGDSINRALVRAGWALALHGAEKDWTADGREAAESRLGMWDLPSACPFPDDTISIVAVQADPPGPDNEILNEEWIDLENPGASEVDLSGWAVRDESSSNRYTFADVVIAPGGELRLHTGCGSDTSTSVHWCSSNGVWSNDGDTALVLGPSGAIVDHLFIDG